MSRICIICALQQESSPILRSFNRAKKARVAEIPAWEFESDNNRIHLLLSGIGLNNAVRTAQIAADLLRPDIVISAGFCGALFPGFETGDIVVAEKLYLYSSEGINHEETSDSILFNSLTFTEHPRFWPGRFISSENIVDKRVLMNHINHLAAASTVLEMESWGVSKVCRERGIRFAAIRAVSDTAENDPAELFRNICDNGFNISIKKISLFLLKNPFILTYLLQLAKSSKIAGRSLADAVHYSLGQMK
jgi:adenosylhomocysteine nucleosidase